MVNIEDPVPQFAEFAPGSEGKDIFIPLIVFCPKALTVNAIRKVSNNLIPYWIDFLIRAMAKITLPCFKVGLNRDLSNME
ncbi:hypothetical protein D9M68_586520 [compost metagenome]